MTKIVIFTGNELRHIFFRRMLNHSEELDVVCCIAEGCQDTLRMRTMKDLGSSELQHLHVSAREQSERDHFKESVSILPECENLMLVEKGQVNSRAVLEKILNLNVDLAICFGSSILDESILSSFKNKFINIHLGLSPYYRGAGTNIWPIIDGRLDCVGVTFMHIDSGIDTGEIIHQIQADYVLGDSCHSIGNRLIKKMTMTAIELILNFNNIESQPQPNADGKIVYKKDFDASACRKLYDVLSSDIIENHIITERRSDLFLVSNPVLSKND